ncbi:MAG: RHS repeat-associated core domain-containing protein [Gammaproteobacteria bacterium]
MTASGTFGTINWNWAGQPSQLLGSVSLYLGYTADGDLLTESVSGQGQSRYFGQLFVQEGDGSWRERIMANGEVVAVVNVSSAGFPSVDYFIHDNLGSTAAVVDASGDLEGRYAWDAWGDLVNPATGGGSDPNASADEALTSIGYTGHEMFWEAGLIHTHARLYDPSIGRWLSPDPTVPDGYDGQSLNRYSYVLNNPMTLTDPLGLCAAGNVCLSPIVVIGVSFLGALLVADGGGPGGLGIHANNPEPQKPKDHCPPNPTSATKIGTDEVKYTDASGNTETLSNGSRSWVTNNPDNVGFPFASSQGSIGSYSAGYTTAIFPSYAVGFAAGVALWGTSMYQGEPTLLSAVNAWTGARPAFTATSSYMQSMLQGLPGASAATSPSDLSPSQLAAAQQTPEGWKSGQMTCGGSGG